LPIKHGFAPFRDDSRQADQNHLGQMTTDRVRIIKHVAFR
jgi:hypothetical protein